MTYHFVVGDTARALRITCLDGGVPMNLTDCVVELRWRSNNGALVGPRAMSIEAPPTAGVVVYQFAAQELVAGSLEVEITITDISGKVMRSLDLQTFQVRKTF